MKRLFEAVPNFSEGRRPEVIAKIVEAARDVEGVRVLDVHADADHNRMVLTLVGEHIPLIDALFRTIELATQMIDLRTHTGEHPRVGASDVVPFIPLGDSTMADAIAAARSLGNLVAESLDIPVFFYEEAALRPDRRNLEHIRGKGFEDLRNSIGEEDRSPDLGPARVHPSAGAIVIGARGPLIAYNVYLGTTDVAVARAIARAVRHSTGGLRYVKALGLDVPAQGQVQVSMNLTNYHRSAMHTVLTLIRGEARGYGVAVTHSEIVGLVPMDALIDAARHYLQLRDLDRDQILENRLFSE